MQRKRELANEKVFWKIQELKKEGIFKIKEVLFLNPENKSFEEIQALSAYQFCSALVEDTDLKRGYYRDRTDRNKGYNYTFLVEVIFMGEHFKELLRSVEPIISEYKSKIYVESLNYQDPKSRLKNISF